MTKQEKIIDTFLKQHNVNAVDIVKIEKNVYEFEIPLMAEVFKAYRVNYKHHIVEGYDMYFEHKSKHFFKVTLNKIKN